MSQSAGDMIYSQSRNMSQLTNRPAKNWERRFGAEKSSFTTPEKKIYNTKFSFEKCSFQDGGFMKAEIIWSSSKLSINYTKQLASVRYRI